MADDVQDRLRALQTKLSQAAAQRARNEVEKENAERALGETKEKLKEFGIVTGDDLRRVREELAADAQAKIAEAESHLAEAGV